MSMYDITEDIQHFRPNNGSSLLFEKFIEKRVKFADPVDVRWTSGARKILNQP